MVQRLFTFACLLLPLSLTGCDAQASKIAADWGNQRWSWGAYDDSIQCFNAAIELNPDYPIHYSRRGMIWSLKRRYDRALADFKEAVRLDAQGEHPFETYNALAWFFATCPDDAHRDGRQAVKLATKACELTDWKNPAILDTLAAAFAEQGDFESAVRWQSKAVELADERLQPELSSRLPLYRSNQPYRE